MKSDSPHRARYLLELHGALDAGHRHAHDLGVGLDLLPRPDAVVVDGHDLDLRGRRPCRPRCRWPPAWRWWWSCPPRSAPPARRPCTPLRPGSRGGWICRREPIHSRTVDCSSGKLSRSSRENSRRMRASISAMKAGVNSLPRSRSSRRLEPAGAPAASGRGRPRSCFRAWISLRISCRRLLAPGVGQDLLLDLLQVLLAPLASVRGNVAGDLDRLPGEQPGQAPPAHGLVGEDLGLRAVLPAHALQRLPRASGPRS